MCESVDCREHQTLFKGASSWILSKVLGQRVCTSSLKKKDSRSKPKNKQLAHLVNNTVLNDFYLGWSIKISKSRAIARKKEEEKNYYYHKTHHFRIQ